MRARRRRHQEDAGRGHHRRTRRRLRHVRNPVLPPMRRRAPRADRLPRAGGVERKVQERVGDGQLDPGQHQVLPQVFHPHREEPGVQPHDVPVLPVRVLLDLHGQLDRSRGQHRRLLPLQQVRPQRRPCQHVRRRQGQAGAGPLSALLQALPRPFRGGKVRQAPAQGDGRADGHSPGAERQWLVGGRRIPQDVQPAARRMPPRSQVHVRLCVLHAPGYGRCGQQGQEGAVRVPSGDAGALH
mmetsp:Transcript_3734/g.8659  ORF Transcript_3734/g.8659 Transcript_3734/m.8659 type:complete len:241 (+) Transcript_3734:393-1115(+)